MPIEKPDYVEGRDYVNVEMDGTFRFKCQRCGFCCEYPPMLQPSELERLSDYFNMEKQGFFEKFCEPDVYNGFVGIKITDGKCAFYIPGEKGTCMIHETKPGDCRIAPLKGRGIFTGNLDDFKHPERLSLSICKGYGRGKEIKVSDFAEEVRIFEQQDIDYGMIAEFAAFLGGFEASNEFVERSISPGTDDWRRVMDFIEKRYGVRILS